ncbi:MAG: hypothetical protein ACQERN_01975 [Thermodesulfobacteriota bacterium]
MTENENVYSRLMPSPMPGNRLVNAGVLLALRPSLPSKNIFFCPPDSFAMATELSALAERLKKARAFF